MQRSVYGAVEAARVHLECEPQRVRLSGKMAIACRR